MNREIKLRVWGKNLNRWSTSNWDFYPFEDLSTLYENNIIQQFTGLKDTSGREIYEGDIVTLSPANFETTHIESNIYEIDITKPLPAADIVYATAKVVWNQTVCQWSLEYINTCETWNNGAASTGLVEHNYLYHVIGTVFENPELLK